AHTLTFTCSAHWLHWTGASCRPCFTLRQFVSRWVNRISTEGSNLVRRLARARTVLRKGYRTASRWNIWSGCSSPLDGICGRSSPSRGGDAVSRLLGCGGRPMDVSLGVGEMSVRGRNVSPAQATPGELNPSENDGQRRPDPVGEIGVGSGVGRWHGIRHRATPRRAEQLMSSSLSHVPCRTRAYACPD
ncbi:MAG: hypothetical protein QOF33_782, partial [Thermomicrobiales bacterium]|nr:hypothetical protein [Thermomicrobiales bacterium]